MKREESLEVIDNFERARLLLGLSKHRFAREIISMDSHKYNAILKGEGITRTDLMRSRYVSALTRKFLGFDFFRIEDSYERSPTAVAYYERKISVDDNSDVVVSDLKSYADGDTLDGLLKKFFSNYVIGEISSGKTKDKYLNVLKLLRASFDVWSENEMLKSLIRNENIRTTMKEGTE